MPMKVELSKDKKQLTIVLDVEEKQSGSGKMTLIAGTGGFASSNAQWEGKPIQVSVNAGVRN